MREVKEPICKVKEVPEAWEIDWGVNERHTYGVEQTIEQSR
jgi:hypothetical protein